MKKINYYVYIDEGGALGKCRVLVSVFPIAKKYEHKRFDEIADYYYGYMPIRSVIRYIQLFKKVFKDENVTVQVISHDNDMAIKIHDQVLAESGLG